MPEGIRIILQQKTIRILNSYHILQGNAMLVTIMQSSGKGNLASLLGIFGRYIWTCWWNLSWYFLLNLIMTLAPLPSLFDAYFWNKWSGSDAWGSGADWCRHHVTCSTALLWKRSLHVVNGGWVSIRQECRVRVLSNVNVGDPWLLGCCLCCGGKYLFKFMFLCGCIALNDILIAWV